MLSEFSTDVQQMLCFGPFRLSPARRLLLEGGKPVRLGSRAFEILVVLLERPGELVSSKELIARVWPSTVVVEANLPVQINALRRALHDGNGGNRYLLNMPGRGYRFVAPVTVAHAPRDSLRAPHAPDSDDKLPATELLPIGSRPGAAVGAVAEELPRRLLGDRAMIATILQRGIWALEFVQTLIHNEPAASNVAIGNAPR